MVLKALGTRFYNFIRKKKLLPLPGDSTLRHWIRHFKCEPGILDDVLHVLEADIISAPDNLYKYGILSFDEMDMEHKYQVGIVLCYLPRHTYIIISPYYSFLVLPMLGLRCAPMQEAPSCNGSRHLSFMETANLL